MSDNSARLNLPYIAPSQAQKHVTHNEAIERLDVVTQLSVVALDAVTPPTDPVAGDVYALGDAPTGDWASAPGQLAYRSDSGWLFVEPRAGWRAWDAQSGTLNVYDGSGWVPLSGGGQNTDGLGIQTSWDATNRLAVSAEATLFSHAGAGHQVKINKASDGDTAALLFQSDWTGHAEFGLAGDTAFSIKISADGTAWQDAMRFDPSAGEIRTALPITGAAVQSAPGDVTPGRLMRADYGYGPGNLLGPVSQSGGVPSGAVIESGSTANGHYTRWADGTQLCWLSAEATFDEARRLAFDWTFPMAFATGTTPVAVAALQAEGAATPGGDEVLGPIARPGAQPHEGCVLRVYRISGGTDFVSGDALPVSLTASGRWF